MDFEHVISENVSAYFLLCCWCLTLKGRQCCIYAFGRNGTV